MKYKLLHPKAKLPAHGRPGDAGYDLQAMIEEPIEIRPTESVLIPTGVAIYIEDPNIVGLIYPRSGLGSKLGIVLGNLTGIIDSQYQGEVMVSLWNRSYRPYTVKPDDRIAQLIFTTVLHPVFEEVEDFDESIRGEAGFGSSGS
jgi:dUTP pyrophosphatase